MESIARKIGKLVQEFPGLKEALGLTIEQAFKAKRVTSINVKRVDGSLLRRVVLERRHLALDSEHRRTEYRRKQQLWVLKGGDAICIDIKKERVVHSDLPHAKLHVEEPGETILSRLGGINPIEYLVLTDEVFGGTIELKVTLYKPAKGSSIAADVAWELEGSSYPVQTDEEVAAETAAAWKWLEDKQNAEMIVALDEYYDKLAQDDDGSDEEDPPEPTEINVGGHPGSWLIFE